MRLSPYFAFAKKSFLQKSAYRFNHLMSILNTIIRIFIFWEIYRALYGGRTEVDGITMSMVTTNFILSLGLEAVFGVDDYYLPNRIRDGSIATELLLPVSFHGRMLASNLGNVGGAVEEGVDGLHFAPGDAAALADAVRRLDALGERLDPAALRDRTLAAYGTEESYRRLMAVYREITGGQHQ